LSRVIFILFILAATTAHCLAATPADFAATYAKAKAAAGTPEGVAYDYTLGMFFMKTHTERMEQCVQLNPQDARVAFRAVYVLNATGVVDEFITERDNGFTQCFRSIVLGTESPKPPFDGYLSPFEWQGIPDPAQ